MSQKKNPRELLTPAALHILLSLAGDDLHGYAIKRSVEERTGGSLRLGPGTLYEAIHRMSGDGWIKELEVQGRRRIYRITEGGQRVLGEELRRLDELLSVAREMELLPEPGTP